MESKKYFLQLVMVNFVKKWSFPPGLCGEAGVEYLQKALHFAMIWCCECSRLEHMTAAHQATAAAKTKSWPQRILLIFGVHLCELAWWHNHKHKPRIGRTVVVVVVVVNNVKTNFGLTWKKVAVTGSSKSDLSTLSRLFYHRDIVAEMG